MSFSKRLVSLIVTVLMVTGSVPAANANSEFVNLSGTITAPAGFELAFGRALVLPNEIYADVDGSGGYSLQVPKNEEVEVVFLTTLIPTGGTPGSLDLFGNWRKSFTFSSASTLNFQPPPPVRLDINVVDGQNQLVPNVILDMDLNQPHDPFTDSSGNTWTGIQRAGDGISRSGNPSSTGEFIIWSFPTTEWSSFTFRTTSGSSRGTSPGFDLQAPKSIKLCLPLNLPESGSLPSGCFGVPEQQFVNLSGTITAPAGFELAFGRALVLPNEIYADVDGSGGYSLQVPKNEEVEVVFLTTLIPTGGTPGSLDLFGNWRKSFTFSSASTLNFQPPPPVRLDINVVDGQNQLVPNVILDMDLNQPHDPFTDSSGNTWTGIQRAGDGISRSGNPSSTGEFIIWSFPTTEWSSFTFRTTSGSSRGTSPGFDLQAPKSIKLCLPLNLPESGSLPSGCFGVPEQQFVNLSGTITAPAGFELAFGRALVLPNEIYADVDGSGGYSLQVPKNEEVEVVFLTTLIPTGGTPGSLDLFGNWRKSFTFSSASTLNFQPPPPVRLDINVVDGQNQLVPNVILDMDLNQPHDPFTDSSGNTWTGIQRAGDGISRSGNPSSTGEFIIWSFPTTEWSSFTFRTTSGSSRGTSPGFDLQAPKSIKLCLPLNLPESGSLPSGCFGVTYPQEEDTVEEQINDPPFIGQAVLSSMEHSKAIHPGSSLKLEVPVSDDGGVSSVRAAVSKFGSSAVISLSMTPVSAVGNVTLYSANFSLPTSAIPGESWQIAIAASDNNNLTSEYRFLFVVENSPSAQTASEKLESVQVQRAGSQLVIYSENDASGTFEVFEDDELIDTFTLGDTKTAHVIEQRVTGEIRIERADSDGSTAVEVTPTRSLLWYENYNLGLVNPSSLNSTQRAAVDGLARSYKSVNGTWTPRGQSTSKFICTGIYGPGASLADKVDARKRAKVACETAQSTNPTSDVSFWFQTKETKALSYVNKVLVTVKGLEAFIEEGLG